MKTCLKKFLSVFLVAVMFLAVLPFMVSGVSAPTFDVKQVSKNGNTITVNIDLAKGTFNSLDLVFEMDGVVCTSISAGSAPTSAGAMFMSNTNVSSGFSNIAIVAMNAVNPGTVAVVTLGIVESSYSFKVKATSCTVTDEDWDNVGVRPIINGSVVGSLAGKVHSVDIGDVSMNYKDSTVITPDVVADSGVEYTVTYSSSNESVATVDENGNVYAAGKGNAEITCTVTDEYGNVVTDTCNVEVKYSFLQWIIIIVLFGWIWY